MYVRKFIEQLLITSEIATLISVYIAIYKNLSLTTIVETRLPLLPLFALVYISQIFLWADQMHRYDKLLHSTLHIPF